MAKQLYCDVAGEANLPISQRRETVIGRAGIRKVPRRYHILDEKLQALRAEMVTTGRFVNPFCENRLYGMVIKSLLVLGENIAHTIGVVYAMFQKVGSETGTLHGSLTFWDRYNQRSPRNEKTHREAFPRFLYNIQSLQRLGGEHPFGFKLAQLGACIDILKNNEGMILIRLRTGIPEGQTIMPINENRQRKARKSLKGLPSGVTIENN